MAEPGAGQSPAGMNHLEPELEEKHKKQEDSDLGRELTS